MPGGACLVSRDVGRRLLSFSVCLRRRFVLCDNGRPDDSVCKVGVFRVRSHGRR
jgi:hypothetical protein